MSSHWEPTLGPLGWFFLVVANTKLQLELPQPLRGILELNVHPTYLQTPRHLEVAFRIGSLHVAGCP